MNAGRAEWNQASMRALPALLALTLLAPACLDDPGPTDQVGSSTQSLATAITWTNWSTTVTPSGNDLVKKSNAPDSWNAGAVSIETIARRGFVEFKTAEIGTNKAIGLSNDDSPDNTLADIDFAIWLYWDGTNGIVKVSESGTSQGTFGTYSANDVFRVEAARTASGPVVTYSKNGTVFYTSATAPTFPLRVDTSLKTPGATINDVVVWAQSSPDNLHVSTQDNPIDASVVSERLHCGTNDVVIISERYLGSDQTIPLQDFLTYSQTDIEDLLENGTDGYLDEFPEMADFAGTLILDIEHPHPQALFSYSETEQDDIVQAYIKRISAVRAVWSRHGFPNAKLGLYGTVNPNWTGNASNQNYIDRVAALQDAGREGLFDDLAYMVPILYVRFGCDQDNSPVACDTVPGKWDTIDEYTQLGIDASHDVTDLPEVADLPLLPILTVNVANSSTATNLSTNFDRWMLLDLDVPDPFYATLGAQLDILAANGVDEAALWIGAGDHYDYDPNDGHDDDVLEVAGADNTNNLTIDDYACAF